MFIWRSSNTRSRTPHFFFFFRFSLSFVDILLLIVIVTCNACVCVRLFTHSIVWFGSTLKTLECVWVGNNNSNNNSNDNSNDHKQLKVVALYEENHEITVKLNNKNWFQLKLIGMKRKIILNLWVCVYLCVCLLLIVTFYFYFILCVSCFQHWTRFFFLSIFLVQMEWYHIWECVCARVCLRHCISHRFVDVQSLQITPLPIY